MVRTRCSDQFAAHSHSAACSSWSKPKIEQAKRGLIAGESFTTLAERFNQTPKGGLRIGITRGHGKKRYERDYFAARPHVLVGPLKELLYYVFEVMKVIPGGPETLQQAESSIRRRLGTEDTAKLGTAAEAAWRMRTRCRGGYVCPGAAGTLP
jgi:hypothetical protein